jgi:hypothetical protein
MRDFTIDGVTVQASKWRTAVRRVRGYIRGEFDINGKTILAKDRTPPGTPMRKKKRKGS